LPVIEEQNIFCRDTRNARPIYIRQGFLLFISTTPRTILLLFQTLEVLLLAFATVDTYRTYFFVSTVSLGLNNSCKL
jgi:hypothetical protein